MYVQHKAFHRPDTITNRLLDVVFCNRRVYHKIDETHVRLWQESSRNAYLNHGFDEVVLDKVISDVNWELSDDNPPRNTWFGEALFFKNETPHVRIFPQSVVGFTPTHSLFNLFGQAGMDHLFGHLYPYFADGSLNESNYNEEVACRLQRKAALSRGGVAWKSIAHAIPYVYLLYKNIPLSNDKS